MEEDNEFINKRKFFRVNLNTPICTEISIIRLNRKKIQSSVSCVCVKDIGIGGIRFSTKLKLPIGENIVYKFKIQILKKCYYIEGNIVWQHTEENGDFSYGVQFLMNDDDVSTFFTIFNNLALVVKHNHISHGCNFCNLKNCPNKSSKISNTSFAY